MNHTPMPPLPPVPVGPTVVDLAAHMAQKDAPKPVDGEQVVVRTYRLDHKAQLPNSMPIVVGKTSMQDEFALTLNPQAGELYLLHEGRDHRIIGLGILADEWIKAAGGLVSPDRPRILRELDSAIVAIDTARAIDTEGSAVTLDEAIDNANAAVSTIESALRLARSLRANLEQRPKPATVTDADELDA